MFNKFWLRGRSGGKKVCWKRKPVEAVYPASMEVGRVIRAPFTDRRIVENKVTKQHELVLSSNSLLFQLSMGLHHLHFRSYSARAAPSGLDRYSALSDGLLTMDNNQLPPTTTMDVGIWSAPCILLQSMSTLAGLIVIHATWSCLATLRPSMCVCRNIVLCYKLTSNTKPTSAYDFADLCAHLAC